ncbi:MAG: DUF3307 domain-containing protein, partial [Coriobacteriia bacterium]|nr:DUF3307 domain-containing protein [Coriobacteriia bacterium]
MTLLLNLYLGHLLGDFVFQPGRLVAAKRKGAYGLLAHASIIGVSTSAILFADLGTLWYVIALAMGAHTLIEIITIRARASTRLSGLSIFLIDQALHILSLVVLVLFATASVTIDAVTTLGMTVDPAWIALACAAILVTFMGSIVVFEVSNTFGPNTWNLEILPYDTARIVGMIERGTALMLAIF